MAFLHFRQAIAFPLHVLLWHGQESSSVPSAKSLLQEQLSKACVMSRRFIWVQSPLVIQEQCCSGDLYGPDHISLVLLL